MVGKSKPLTCFVSVPRGTKTDGLRRALDNLDVRVGALDELSPAGSNFVAIIENEMRAADFVCVVLGRALENSSALFELGLAVGLGRPILIVAQDRNALPATIAAYPVVHASANDVEALSFHLRIFLQNFRQSANAAKNYRGQNRPSPGHLRSRSTELMKTLVREGSDFEELILSALHRKGIEAVASPAQKSSDNIFRPDFAVWFPDTPPDIGNPIILEAKRTERQEVIQKAVEQVGRYLQAGQTRTGIVIYEGTQTDIGIYAVGRGYVFVISINEFLRRVQGGNLIKRLVTRRNRFAHTGD